MIEDDLHDKITKAYLEYFKANEWWETRRSVRAYYKVQQCLKEIRRLTKQRIDENKQLFQTKGTEQD